MDLEMARVAFLGKHENIENIPLNGNGIGTIFGQTGKLGGRANPLSWVAGKGGLWNRNAFSLN